LPAELRLIYPTQARDALRSHDDYLRPRSAKAADAVLAEVEALCNLIAEFPDIGRSVPRTSLRLHVTRKYRYRVAYRATPGLVEVIDFLHPSRR